MPSPKICLMHQTPQDPELQDKDAAHLAPKESTIYISADVEDELKQLPPLPSPPATTSTVQTLHAA